jgi:hypothetical protein
MSDGDIIERIYEAKQTYRCTVCGSIGYSTNGDKDKAHVDGWRKDHLEGRHDPMPKSTRTVPGTQLDLIHAIQRGEVPGIKWDPMGPKSARYTWESTR